MRLNNEKLTSILSTFMVEYTSEGLHSGIYEFADNKDKPNAYLTINKFYVNPNARIVVSKYDLSVNYESGSVITIDIEDIKELSYNNRDVDIRFLVRD